jgi:hypothetical protein
MKISDERYLKGHLCICNISSLNPHPLTPQSKRRSIYSLLISKLRDDQRVSALARLFDDVIAQFVDGVLDVEAHKDILHDALWILSSKV